LIYRRASIGAASEQPSQKSPSAKYKEKDNDEYDRPYRQFDAATTPSARGRQPAASAAPARGWQPATSATAAAPTSIVANGCFSPALRWRTLAASVCFNFWRKFQYSDCPLHRWNGNTQILIGSNWVFHFASPVKWVLLATIYRFFFISFYNKSWCTVKKEKQRNATARQYPACQNYQYI
jgi:hypothetical protein